MTLAMEMRVAGRGDASEIAAIFRPILIAGETHVWPRFLTDDEINDIWLSSSVHAVVAVSHGRIVGCYALKPVLPGAGAHIANGNYIVAAQERGKGIGKALGTHSIIAAKRLGFRAMQFNAVVDGNVAAVRLWKSLGFTIVGRVPEGFRHPHRGLVDILIMHRSLQCDDNAAAASAC